MTFLHQGYENVVIKGQSAECVPIKQAILGIEPVPPDQVCQLLEAQSVDLDGRVTPVILKHRGKVRGLTAGAYRQVCTLKTTL